MTIDERLEALTARHEALAQTLELTAAMQQDSERRWEQRFERWEQRFQLWDQRFDKIATALQQDGENIRALARVAELQHERLSRIEDQH
jgi:hypothetical protein